MKKERGAVTILTLVTILFIISFLVSTFAIIMNRRQAQAEIKKKTLEIYESDIGQEEQIYKSYFAHESEVVPIYTAEQLFKVGTGEFIVSDNKIYECTEDANYKLASNIVFEVKNYSEKEEYKDNFDENDTWINIEENDELTGMFDYNGNTILEIGPDGNELKHEEGVTYIEYIEGTGTQYIDTEITPNQDTKVELQVMLNKLYTDVNLNTSILGTRSGVNSNAYTLICGGSNYLYSGYGTTNTNTNFVLQKETLYTIVKDKNATIVNGETVTTASSATFTSPYSLVIFATRNGATSPTFYGNMKLYYCKIYNGDELVSYLKPALDSDGIACLYDEITKQYFYNSGTGTFNYQ